jgi:hypothetical protein
MHECLGLAYIVDAVGRLQDGVMHGMMVDGEVLGVCVCESRRYDMFELSAPAQHSSPFGSPLQVIASAALQVLSEKTKLTSSHYIHV